jgi:glyoxylase-like metal-dependent hydrolase (beta-lactamase superfamily II)
MQDCHQLFDPVSSTYTYVLLDAGTRDAVMIDPVDSQFDAYSALIDRERLRVRYVLETHAHADHITGASLLRERTGAKAAAPLPCGIVAADLQLEDGAELRFGGETLRALHTPGHTAGSMSFRWRDAVFTGDALLIGGCGRTDFQSGDAGALYDSITKKLFSLPDETIVFPGHDYRGRTSSTIGAEKRDNPRLAGRSRDAFIELMSELRLPRPRLIDVAVPANQRLGQDVHEA